MEDVERIIQSVKEATLEAGNCEPSLFVIGSERKLAIALKSFGDNANQREMNMMDAGAFTAYKHSVGELKLLVFASEAWMSPARTEHFVMPSADPNRIEALIINSLDPATHEESMIAFEMVRDTKGKLTDLKQMSLPDAGSVEGILLPAFQKGYQLIRPTTN